MKIGLIDVDWHNGFPNLALMRISAWHKARGDSVEWWTGFIHYDRVYMSKVFTFSPDVDTVIDADEIIRGGTGYKDYGSLPPEIEATAPDYTIYPKFDSAIGFLTRGCIRNCPWCIVPKKEGSIRPAATWQEIKRNDSRKIVFLDNNVLASDFGLQQIEDMGGKPVWVDFNQGLDARIITPEVANLLARLHWIWQRYASPVWMDIKASDTLQAKSAREAEDERHICPLQLGVIRRALNLWTNPGDFVLTPFLGIGSEAVVALEMGRKAVGIELKGSYFDQAVKNCAGVSAMEQIKIEL